MSRQLFKVLPALKMTDEFTKSVAKMLYRKRNWWLPNCRIASYEYEIGGYTYKDGPALECYLKSPKSNPDFNLKFNTYANSITMYPKANSTHHYHSHNFPERSLEFVVNHALTYIDEYINEDAVFVYQKRKTRKDVTYIAEFTCFVNKLSSLEDIVRIESWKGTYDKVFTQECD